MHPKGAESRRAIKSVVMDRDPAAAKSHRQTSDLAPTSQRSKNGPTSTLPPPALLARGDEETSSPTRRMLAE
jgi:hypothetical protein